MESTRFEYVPRPSGPNGRVMSGSLTVIDEKDKNITLALLDGKIMRKQK